ncbi:MAG: OPT family oligopeptide transporter [Planctomycetota bacterium]|nr:MAG: OPT family oligopeptide transporter [Planctomycetota bacterium]
MPDPLATRQLTLRAAATGAVLGALLVPCNVYSGLKIGWSFNMSIAAALLSCGFWATARRVGGEDRIAHWGMLENNINQTCASSAASIISAGLVAPIPALAILTGQTLRWPVLSVWLFTVSLIGVLVGLSLRRQMLEVQKLPFPSGIATAETVREIYARGSEAASRVKHLLGAGAVAATTKLAGDFLIAIPQIGPALGLGRFGLSYLNLRNLGFVLDPSFLMIGFGAIVGVRVGWSMLLGAGIAWGVLAPWLYSSGRLPEPADPGVLVFGQAVEFLLWPGVTMIVTAALVSFFWSLPGLLQGFARSRKQTSTDKAETTAEEHSDADVAALGSDDLSWGWWLAGGFAIATLLATVTQVMIFGIALPMALLAIGLTFVLAIVAARVSGETGIPPIGALGKVTQLTFGLIHPTSVGVNLMTANVTGGAAGQCSDLLHDLKTGKLLGASVRAQAWAQVLGVLVGSMAGSAAYLVLVPDPAGMLLTEEWPAPAVATWKAVAELFRDGIDAAPSGALTASIIGGCIGTALAVVNQLLPQDKHRFCPSAVSIGLAFVIPAFNSISLFLGAMAAALATRVAPGWASRFILPIAAGFVAGESLAGVASALVALLTGS